MNKDNLLELLPGKYSVGQRINQRKKYVTLYLGTDKNSGQKIVIKCIDREALVKNQKNKEAKKIEQTLVQEQAKIMKELMKCQNQNIVGCYEIFQNKKFTIFILEYCNQGTLSDQIRKKGGKLSQKQAVFVLAHLLCGFAALHKMKIIHRNVTTDNVFIHNGVYKIGDFQISSLSSSIRSSLLGDKSSMAPEVIEEIGYSTQADIWSLGIIIYEMLVGQTPFSKYKQLDQQTILNKNKDIKSLSISQNFKSLLQSLFVKDPEKRLKWIQLYKMNSEMQGVFVSLRRFSFVQQKPSKGSTKNEIPPQLKQPQRVMYQMNKGFQDPKQIFIAKLKKVNLSQDKYNQHILIMKQNLKISQKIKKGIIQVLWNSYSRSYRQNENFIHNRTIQAKLLILVTCQIIDILEQSSDFTDLGLGGKIGKYCYLNDTNPLIQKLNNFLRQMYDLKVHLINKIGGLQSSFQQFIMTVKFQDKHIDKVLKLKDQLLRTNLSKKISSFGFYIKSFFGDQPNQQQLNQMQDFIDNQYSNLVQSQHINRN